MAKTANLYARIEPEVDEIQEREIASVEFELGDVVYLLMDMDADAAALDTLARMAQEVIEAAKD